MGQIEALTKAIISLRITCCYEEYHNDHLALRQEAMRRHEAANREQILRDQETTRRRIEDYRNLGGPMTQPGYMIGPGDNDDSDAEQMIQLRDAERIIRLQGGPHMANDFSVDETSTPEAPRRWKDMKTENETVFTNLWQFQMTDHKLIGAHYDPVAEYPVPQAYGGRRKHEREDAYAYRGLMIGFDLLVRALQRANIYPQTFAIPTPSINFHCFATSASQSVLCHILSKTQTLHLNQVSERYISTSFDIAEGRGANLRNKLPPPHTEMGFTSRNFPCVRNLTISTRFDMVSKPPNGVLQDCALTPDDVVQLDSLTVKLHPLCAANTQLLLKNPNCLNHFDPYLKHLIIKNTYHENWNGSFRAIARTHLESLIISIEPNAFPDVRRNTAATPHFPGMMGPPEVLGLICVQELFESSAVICKIEPEWVYRRVRGVWRKQEAVVDRLLEDSEEEGPFDCEEDEEGDIDVEDDD